MKYLSRLLMLFFFFGNLSFVLAQQEVTPNNQDIFDDFLYRRGNEYRTASGVPGPEYWQNRADYSIEVELDEPTHILKGKLTLTYTNNSPEELPFIWMYVEQNRFTAESRGALTSQSGRYRADLDGGMTISNLVAKVRRSTSSKWYVTDTRMRVDFDQPIPAKGGKATVSMDFEFKVDRKSVV